MSRFLIALRAFVSVLRNARAAARIEEVLASGELPKSNAVEKTPPAGKPAQPAAPARSEAITLLAALQREARLVDLVQQPLAEFSDEQIGAAARNILGDCRSVLDRFFALAPVASEGEGETIELPMAYDAACFKLTGRVEGSGPFRGAVVHQGWQATAVNLPSWTGGKESALIIAPAEVDIAS
jgi:hypothetical protein